MGRSHVEGQYNGYQDMPGAERTRCHKLQKQCVFFEIPRDPISEWDNLLPMDDLEN